MKFDPRKHRRRSIRLKGYDYSQPGAYFITVCTYLRECMLGEVINGEMRLNELGQFVHRVWRGLPKHYPNVVLDAFCVMPNHFHGIIILTVDDQSCRGESQTRPYRHDLTNQTQSDLIQTYPKRHGLPEIVRALKSFSSRHINQWRDSTGTPVWQRNYYESIIRNERQLNAIQKYIHENPNNWEKDMDNPKHI